MEIVYARDYGLTPDNAAQDTGEALRRMFKDHPADTRFILEKGRYDFDYKFSQQATYHLSNADPVPCINIAVLLKGMRNIEFDGNGSLFVFHGRISAFVIDGCKNITLRGLIIDWDIPLSSEGTVIDSGDNWFDVRIDPVMYPHHIEDGRLIFDGEGWSDPMSGAIEFDTCTRRVTYGTGDTIGALHAEQIDSGIIRLSGMMHSQPKPGNTLVLRHSDRAHPCIIIYNSGSICVQDFTMHASAGVGVLANFSEDLTFCNVQMRANEMRGRVVLSGHVDGLQLSNVRGKVLVERCWFHGLMDDSINMHGTATRVERIIDNHTLVCAFGHRKSQNLELWASQGHRISLIDHLTMYPYGEAVVSTFLLLDEERFMVQFQDELPSDLKNGDALENITNTAALTVRDCFFGSGRARSILVSTPRKVLIEKNLFESSGSAILMAGDANYWYESGACHDVKINDNTFLNCLTSEYQFCGGIISLWPEVPEIDKNKPFHTNVAIENNLFQMFEGPVLYAQGAYNLHFENNLLMRSNVYDPRNKPDLIRLYCSSDVHISGNRLTGALPGSSVSLMNMSQDDVLIDSRQSLNLTLAD